MTRDVSAEMVFARLQLLAPGARALLVAAPRTNPDVSRVARELAESIARGGHRVRWLDATGGENASAPPAGVEPMNPEARVLADVEQAKRALAGEGAYTVICGGGILDSAAALVLASAADGVILVVRVARTGRADLSAARADIERVGGTLLGAVLLS